ncbi:MAG: hypothetical protein J7M38_10540 [Armatimonadetes bacterium]|nr:hypothetical protein [Armatimonadota bacterium]
MLIVSRKMAICAMYVIAIAMLLSTPAHCAEERVFVGDGHAVIMDDDVQAAEAEARHKAEVAALRAAAHDITGTTHSPEEASLWLTQWERYGLSKYVASNKRLGDTVVMQVALRVDVEDLRGVIMGGTTPKNIVVGVMIYEEILRLPPPPDPAAETAVRQALLVAGYQVLDARISDRNRARDIARAARRGDAKAIDWLCEQFDADWIVYGEAFAEETAQGGVYLPNRFTGTCELHVVVRDTARAIAAATGTAVAEAETPAQCGKLALRDASSKAASAVLAMAESGSLTTPISVIVHEVAYLRTASAIGAELKRLVGEEAISRPRLDLQNHTCSWDVRAGISATELALALAALQTPRLQVLEASGQRVVVRVVD